MPKDRCNNTFDVRFIKGARVYRLVHNSMSETLRLERWKANYTDGEFLAVKRLCPTVSAADRDFLISAIKALTGAKVEGE